MGRTLWLHSQVGKLSQLFIMQLHSYQPSKAAPGRQSRCLICWFARWSPHFSGQRGTSQQLRSASVQMCSMQQCSWGTQATHLDSTPEWHIWMAHLGVTPELHTDAAHLGCRPGQHTWVAHLGSTVLDSPTLLAPAEQSLSLGDSISWMSLTPALPLTVTFSIQPHITHLVLSYQLPSLSLCPQQRPLQSIPHVSLEQPT